MRVFHSLTCPLPLPEGHRFPVRKYDLLVQLVREARVVTDDEILASGPASDDDLALVHDRAYIRAVDDGSLPDAVWRRIGFPWSPELALRSRCSVGGTIAAVRAATEDGTAVHLAGGTHHAFRDFGEGYCVYNDIAVAIRAGQRDGHVRRALVVDCDVHQGNGTAAIFRGDASVFTFSMHGARNFPARKEPSDLDIGLPDGVGDVEYLDALAHGLDRCLAAARADLAVYLSGADAWEGDRLGKLRLTPAGMAERDRLVLSRLRDAGLGVAVAMGGGHAPDPLDTARIHLETVRVAAAL
jgi:acetoin utilization deacetylase AcuC-like enzyme